jgi:tryptophan-rich sensory protein
VADQVDVDFDLVRLRITEQFALIIATVVAFYRLDRSAAFCLVPLMTWVAFAIAINFSIWILNR